MNAHAEQYDVAFSYAAEDRDKAKELARRLHRDGYSIFYDEFQQTDLWGESLADKLKEIFTKQSRFCLMFVSKHYVSKPWTNMERRWVLTRVMKQDTAYALPVFLDDSKLRGFPDDMHFYDFRRGSMKELFQRVKQKLALPGERPSTKLRLYPTNFLWIVVAQANVEVPTFNLDCHLVNDGKQPGRVEHLDVTITNRWGTEYEFTWSCLYEFIPGTLTMRKTSKPQTIEVPAKGSKLLGVQFIAPFANTGPSTFFSPRLPASILQMPALMPTPDSMWSPGSYDFHLKGSISGLAPPAERRLHTSFKLQISSDSSTGIAMWKSASQEHWRQLNDPDNAAGVPAIIDQTTLTVR